ncbi:MAG: hypothetical protein HOZ81_20485 [Streptomyces sp.]|nr:hypothetical protein [Streptomyces sp.]
MKELDAGDWISIGTAVIAIAAAVISAWQASIARSSTKQQLALTERIHREQNEPYVIVDIQPQDPYSGVLVVIIENIGPTVARNVRISCDPPLVSGWGDDLTEMVQHALSRTIPMMPPGRRLEFLLDNQERFNSDLPMAYTFTVNSEGPAGPVETLEYTVDFGTWAESLLKTRPTKQVEDKLGKIHDHLKKLSDNYKLANGPRIRDENERIRQIMREARERRNQAAAPPSD